MRPFFRAVVLATLMIGLGVSAAATTDSPGADLAGYWKGEITAPDVATAIPFELIVEIDGSSSVRGSMAVPGDHSPLVGEFLKEEGILRVEGDFDDDTTVRLALERVAGDRDRLVGTATKGDMRAPVTCERAKGQPQLHHDRGIELPATRPTTVDRAFPDAAVAKRLGEILDALVKEKNAIGVSVAVVGDGKILDARSVGYADLGNKTPANGKSMYRWASISKPLTAVAALQLVETGKLDLDRDVREYVPEFPKKEHPITSRQLLAHLGGIVHYSNGKVIRTEREYTVEHPDADTLLCLDRFKESPLVSVPGRKFNYTTHGYMLLGAVVERAGGAPYAEQVQRRILEPLGMKTMQPDYPWVDIPHRVAGYSGLRIGLATLDEDRDVCWKLPGGGWISTIGDLARFALGMLAPGKLLGPETMKAMCTPPTLPDGKRSTYGYGIGAFDFDGHPMIGHSGSQSKTVTYMVLCPKLDRGVVVMSNSRNFQARRLALLWMREVARAKTTGSDR